MGQNLNIYLNNEASFSLEEKKKKDPDFNLSAFIQEKLIEITEKKLDSALLSLEIERKKSQINLMKNEVDILEEQKRMADVEKERKLKQEAEKKILNEQRYKEQVETYKKNMTAFFELSEVQAYPLAVEFANLPKETRGTIFSFLKDKNIKEREDIGADND